MAGEVLDRSCESIAHPANTFDFLPRRTVESGGSSDMGDGYEKRNPIPIRDSLQMESRFCLTPAKEIMTICILC